MKEQLTLKEKLNHIQTKLKAAKSKTNNFGKYSYRSAEDILLALKPLKELYRVDLTFDDFIESFGSTTTKRTTTTRNANGESVTDEVVEYSYNYVRSVAKLIDLDSTEVITAQAYARESADKKGMDPSQMTGATSSYARKYALNALFCIDDDKDADTDERKRAEVFAQLAGCTSREQFEQVQRAYLNIIKADSFLLRAAEMVAQIYPRTMANTQLQTTSADLKQAMQNDKI